MIDRAAAVAIYPGLRLFIAGAWVERDGRDTVPVVDPTSERVLGELPCATAADMDAAIAASAVAFSDWRRVPALDRSRLLRAVAGRLRDRREEWAGLIALELGKPIAQALIETETACELFEWAAEEARRLYDRQIPPRSAGMRLTAVSEPAGPVGAISGWNAPAITPARKIAGAVAAGCSIVLKPSEAAPASALMIAHAFVEAGTPPGLVNIVFGDPPAIGRRLATDPGIRVLTFTGGTSVGKELAALCAGTVKRMVLELGGHAPALVFADVDVEAVATSAAAAKFRNAGQVCTSPTRFLVHEAVYERFVERFVAAMETIVVGDPFDPRTQMGPLQNSRRVASTRALVDDAAAVGATVHAGKAPSGAGFWHSPTMAADLPSTARALHEEPFGPLALASKFTTTEQALAEANRLSFGLASYAFTNDLHVAEQLAREIEAGSLAINHWAASYPETPFGGVKESGLGMEGGSEGVMAFRTVRFVSVASRA